MPTDVSTTHPTVSTATSIVLPLPAGAPSAAATPAPSRRKQDWLAESLLELSPTRPKRSVGRIALSVVMHIVILAVAILPPLYYTQTIDMKQFTQTFLVGPPPPPPPPPAPQAMKQAPATKRVFTANAKLLAPTAIPQKVAMLKEQPLEPESAEGIFGGVPGGVPGGQAGGVIGGIISGTGRTAVPAPPGAPRSGAPIRVGGRVKAPRLIQSVKPQYPPLARQTRLQGQVTLDAIIDTEGNVVEMRVISGHPLLISAATDAVSKWKYEPTYLNDKPISVQLIVTVTFQLSQ